MPTYMGFLPRHNLWRKPAPIYFVLAFLAELRYLAMNEKGKPFERTERKGAGPHLAEQGAQS